MRQVLIFSFTSLDERVCLITLSRDLEKKNPQNEKDSWYESADPHFPYGTDTDISTYKKIKNYDKYSQCFTKKEAKKEQNH